MVTWHPMFQFGGIGGAGGCVCCGSDLITWHDGFAFCVAGSAPAGAGGLVAPYYCCMVTCCV